MEAQLQTGLLSCLLVLLVLSFVGVLFICSSTTSDIGSRNCLLFVFDICRRVIMNHRIIGC